jgi:hypothetical protein
MSLRTKSLYFTFLLLLRVPRLRLFLLGVVSGPRAASLRMLKTVFLLVPVAVAVSEASQPTEISGFFSLYIVEYIDHNLPFFPFNDCPLLRLTVGTSAISQKHTVKFDTKRAQTDTSTNSRKTFALHCIRFVYDVPTRHKLLL